ncbi:MAG: hypothetical protein ACO2ON_01790 [Candidatus Nanopusillus sp.]
MGILETYKKSIDLVKNHIAESLIYGALFYILWKTLFLLPIIGAFLFSYFYPRLTKWYYTKVTGEDINPDYKTAFKSLLIPSLLISLGIIIILAILISILINLLPDFADIDEIGNISLQQLISIGLSSFPIFTYVFVGTIIGIITIIASGVVWLLLLYSIYGSIFGKVNKLSINVEKSFILFAYWFLFKIIASIVLLIIGKIFSLIFPLLGGIVVLILNIIVVYPAMNLILLLRAKEF